MAGPERRAFFCATAAALVPLIGAYMLMTAYRSFRDYFAPEIYSAALGREPTAVDYLVADWPGGLVATAAVSALVKVRLTQSRQSKESISFYTRFRRRQVLLVL